jgi:NAD(P)H-dependent FMN reductase
MIRIAVIIGSTRPERFGELPATWIADRLAARGDLDVAVVSRRTMQRDLQALADLGVRLVAAPGPW